MQSFLKKTLMLFLFLFLSCGDEEGPIFIEMDPNLPDNGNVSFGGGGDGGQNSNGWGGIGGGTIDAGGFGGTGGHNIGGSDQGLGGIGGNNIGGSDQGLGGNQGGSGGEPQMDSGQEECPVLDPNIFTLNHGDSIQVEGTTENHTNEYFAACSSPDANDIIYQIILPSEGVIRIQLEKKQDDGYDPAFFIKKEITSNADSECSQTAGVYACSNSSSDSSMSQESTESIYYSFSAGTYYIFVDGGTEVSGPFILSAQFDAPSCGDGLVSTGEQCDDTNTNNGDGCDANCNLESQTDALNICNGESHLLDSQGLVLSGNTTGYSDDYVPGSSSGSPGTCFTYSAPPNGASDVVYQITPATSGTLTASIGYNVDDQGNVTGESCNGDFLSNISLPECWDYVLYARSTCEDSVTQMDCSDGNTGDTPEIIEIQVEEGRPYWIFVDGLTNNKGIGYGSYNLILTLQP